MSISIVPAPQKIVSENGDVLYIPFRDSQGHQSDSKFNKC